MNFYYFDSERLEYTRLNFKPLILTVLIVLGVSFSFRHLYFDAAIVETTDWRGEKVKTTVEKYLKQRSVERKYDKDYKKYLKTKQ